MVYDCPSACSTPADNIPPLSFCASRNNFRSCPGSTTFSNLDNLARWDAIDNVTSILKKSLPSYSGEFVYNVTGTTCGDTIAAVSCAVNIPVCEAGSHTRKLCNASMCDTLSTSCYNLLDRTQIQALCNHFSPRVEHTITNNPDGCFNLDYEGPSYVQWVIGFMLCVVFAAMSSLALNLQKSSLNEADKKDIPTPLCRQPKWVLGMVILVTGSIVDFIAYGLAPQSVLTPLGGMVLVWNVVISTCFFGERAGKREWISTIIIFLGTTLSVIFADHYSPIYSSNHIIKLYSNPYFITYMIVIPIFALFHYGILRYVQYYNLSNESHPNHKTWQTLECLGYAGTAGTLGSQAILFAKQFMELLKANATLGDNIWIRWQLYGIVLAIPIFLASNITFLNAGLRHYSALQTVPIYQTYWMIIGTVSGLIYFKEIDEMSVQAQAFFWIGIVTSVIGIAILSGRTPERIMTAEERKNINRGNTLPESPPLMGHNKADDGGSSGMVRFQLNDESDTVKMLHFDGESSYGAVAFSDFLDASALKSVGDMMVESGFVPNNSVVRDVFIRPPQVSSGSVSSTGSGGQSNSTSPKGSPKLGPSVLSINRSNCELRRGSSESDDGRTSPRNNHEQSFRTLGERNARIMAEKGMESPRRSSLRRRGGSNDGTAQTDEIPIAVSL